MEPASLARWLRASSSTVLTFSLLAGAGCGSTTSEGEEVGAAQVALTQAPTDVSCLEITVTGTRQVIKRFAVTPGSSQRFEMTALPLGDVQFTALAFAEDCANHQSAAPTWISDPVVATIARNVVAQVMLTMRRNGRVSVGIDFADCVAGFVDLGTLDGTETIVPVDMNNHGQIVGTTATEPFLWSGGIMRPLGTGAGSSVVAINDKGQIAGTSGYAFVWEAGVTYRIEVLGLGWTSPLAINEAGQVAGITVTWSGDQHVFVWRPGGSFSDLGTLGGSWSYPKAINASGQVVGESTTAASQTHAFLAQAGTMRDLGTLGGEWSGAVDINAVGQVVGSSMTAAGERHAFIWEAGTMHDLGTLGGEWSDALAINGSGEVVGQSNATPGGPARAFLWVGGTIRDLGTFGGADSAVFGRRSLNDAGEIVGQSENGPGELHAFLWRDGTLNDLGTGGAPITSAFGINSAHQIFGSTQTLSGRQRGFFFDTNVCQPGGTPAGGAP